MKSINGILWTNHGRLFYQFDALHLTEETFRNPPLDVNRAFQNYLAPVNVACSIHKCIVNVYGEKFLVLGYYNDHIPVNVSLAEKFSHFVWRGKISVLFIGTLSH